MGSETESQHESHPTGNIELHSPIEEDFILEPSSLNDLPRQHRVGLVSHDTNDWDPDFVQQNIPSSPHRGSTKDDIESVIRDAGYSLDPSDEADETPAKQSFDLTGLGTQFDPNNDHRPNSAAVIGDLEHWIRRKRISYPERYPKRSKLFLPVDQLERCMTPENIQRELHRAYASGDIDSITSALCKRGKRSRQRIFATLCMFNMSAHINDFIDENIFDTDLPFLFGNDRCYREAVDQYGRHLHRIALFQSDHWTPHLRESFERYQSQLSVPIFKLSWLANDKVLHFPLKYQVSLPFEYIWETSGIDELGSQLQIEGGTSVVRKVKIHPAHYNAPQDEKERDKIFFAVKELAKVTRGTHEAVALKRLNNGQHPHLIRLLATFTYRERFHLIFPWADGNLKEFWETRQPRPSGAVHAPESVTWMSEQILGLSRALKLIHLCNIDDTDTSGLSVEQLKVHGRHGDLKPEIILWFKDERTSHETSIGVLKIGDFGFADFHTKHSRSNVRRSAVDGITPTYGAPEYDVTQRVSPQFDIWSFGCILLQFVVWYLRAWDGIEDFSKTRAEEYEGFLFASDNFYSLQRTRKGSYQAKIKHSVGKTVRNLKTLEACSDYILDVLEFVETQMLRVDITKRARIDTVIKHFEDLEELCRRNPEYRTKRTKEAKTDGSFLAEIVELPEQSDEKEAEGWISTQYAHSPTSIWPTENHSTVDRHQAVRERQLVTSGAMGLGIKVPDIYAPPQASAESLDRSKNPSATWLTKKASDTANLEQKKSRKSEESGKGVREISVGSEMSARSLNMSPNIAPKVDEVENIGHTSRAAGPFRNSSPLHEEARVDQKHPTSVKSETNEQMLVVKNQSQSISSAGPTDELGETTSTAPLAPVPSAPEPTTTKMQSKVLRARASRRIKALVDFCFCQVDEDA